MIQVVERHCQDLLLNTTKTDMEGMAKIPAILATRTPRIGIAQLNIACIAKVLITTRV
jgi:hypothetical protein